MARTAGMRVLNLFAYTCAFAVPLARAILAALRAALAATPPQPEKSRE